MIFLWKKLLMKTIIVIPARAGSKRLPQKNIKILAGIPLIAHTILYAQENRDYIDDIFVSTDDKEIKKIALKYGAKVVDRPKKISGDLEPTVSAIKHTLEVSNMQYVENIITLQATNPLRPKNLLKEALDIYINENHSSLFTVSQHQKKLGHIKNERFTPYNYKIGQRSQDIKPLFFENGLLYISKKNLILEGLIFDKNAYPLIVEEKKIIDIDTQDDLNYAEYLIKHE